MPAPVYDDEKTSVAPNGSHDDLGVSADQRKQEISDLENQFGQSDAKASSLDDEEKSALGDPTSFYKPTGASTGPRQNVTAVISNAGGKKLLAWVLGPLIVIGLLLFMMSALKIPNYAANIAAYRLARSSMDYAKTSAEIDSAKIAVDSTDDTAFKAMQDKYSSLRTSTWGKLDKYRPEVLYNNMKSNGTLSYESTSYKSKLGFTRTKISAVVINGERIPIDSSSFKKRFGLPFANYSERVGLATNIQANVDKALQSSNSLVRSSVAKKIRADLGINLDFWEKAGAKYRGLKPDEASRELLKDSEAKIKVRPTGTPATSEIQQATQDVQAAEAACLEKPACADQLAQGIIPDEISSTLTKSTAQSVAQKAVDAASPVYAVAMPACLIYDGSIDKASDAVDAQSASAVKSSYALQTAGTQQRLGATSAEAVTAFNRKLAGSAGASVPDQYLSGKAADTSVEKSPEASAAGDFTLIDALVKNEKLAALINGIAGTTCPALTNLWVNFGLIAGQLVLAFFTGGGSGIGEEAAAQGIKPIISAAAKKSFVKVLERVTTKEGLKANVGFAKKFGRDFIAIEGLTILAKEVVLSRSGLVNDGSTSAGAEFINQADMGATIQNNQLEQQMMYGAPMTQSATTLVDGSAQTLLAQQDKLSPGMEKYFGITTPLSKIFHQTSIGVNNVKTKGVASIASLLNFNNISSIFFPQKHANAAATDSYYGTVQWGWTSTEEALINKDASYGLLENGEVLSGRQSQVDAIESEYSKCFTSTMGDLLKNGDIKRDENGDVIADQGTCSPNSLGPKNSKYGDTVFRWRLFKKREAVIDHNLGIQSPSQDAAITANQCSVPGSSNKNVYVIGDSISVGMSGEGKLKDKLATNGWTTTIDALSGDSISGGLKRITSNKATFGQAGVVVVELGTNNWGSDETQFKKEITDFYTSAKVLNPSAKYYWVNYVGNGKYQVPLANHTKTLLDLATANNITIIDWASIGAPLIGPNDVHPGGHYSQLTDLVKQSLSGSTGCSSTTATGWVWPIKKEDLKNWSTLKNNEASGSGLNQCWLHQHITSGVIGYHAALDIGVVNKPVYAANDGKIVRKASDGYNTLVIQADGSPTYYAVYEHMSTISVSVGDTVKAGQQIGVSGDVGAPGAPHLHFGISTTNDRFGTYADPWATVNPLDFLPNDYSPALLKDDNTGSCLTKDIMGRPDFGFNIYKTKGVDPRYK